MRRVLALLLACAGVLAVPSGAFAQRTCNAPPGTSAVEQYCEWVPSASGDRRPPQERPPVRVPAGTLRELGQTPAGQELARSLGQDPAGKPRGKRQSGRGGKGETAGKGLSPAEPSDNPLAAVQSAVAAGPGVSDVFPIALLAVTVIMLGWAWVTYRRRRTD